MRRAMVTALLTAVPLLACSGSDPNPVLPGAVPKAPEATRRPVNSPPTVSLDYNGGASHDIITFANAASIDATDFLFARGRRARWGAEVSTIHDA